MKILKNILVLILFSNLIGSCTAEDIAIEEEKKSIIDPHATGDEKKEIDETEKG